MAVDVEGITPGLGSSVEQVALPFDATESSQMTIWTTHNVVKDNVIQLSCSPLVLFLVRYQQSFGRIRTNPLGRFVSSHLNTGWALLISYVIHSGSGSKSSSCTTPSLSAGGTAHSGSGLNLAGLSK
jgi:hypothetical protein